MVSAIDDSFDARLNQLNERIARACQACGRDRRSVHLIGVSKTKPAADVVTAYEAGLQDFGENYLQEAIDKVESLAHLDLTWHYIGNIQSNKTKDVANNFDWVHTVDRVKVGKRLSDQRSKKRPLQILIQVNIDNDPNKSGCQEQDLPELMEALICMPNLELRGLMTILSQDSDPRASYESVAQLHFDMCERLPAAAQQRWNTLSMGMSGDMEHAIAAGATHIRIGTALFGTRA